MISIVRDIPGLSFSTFRYFHNDISGLSNYENSVQGFLSYWDAVNIKNLPVSEEGSLNHLIQKLISSNLVNMCYLV